MLRVIVIALVCLTGFAAASSQEDFAAYVARYNKVYSAEEFAQRFANYVATEATFAAKKAEFGADFGHNQFSDLTVDEFRAQMLLDVFDPNDQCIWPFSMTAEGLEAPNDSGFDWRSQSPNPVTEVKDQGQCGSCWSFSTTGNIEGQWILGGNTAVTLAEQELVDCSNACLQSEPNLCNGGCNGGLPWLAYGDIITWGGITDEASYPYTAMTGACQSAGKTVAAKISKWSSVTSDLSTIESVLQSTGPLSVTMNANVLMSYTGGIITGTSSSCPGAQSDHAILLVGFGDDATSGTHYWIVKNSWGTSWGEQGYFRIQADSQDLCGLQDCVTSSAL